MVRDMKHGLLCEKVQYVALWSSESRAQIYDQLRDSADHLKPNRSWSLNTRQLPTWQPVCPCSQKGHSNPRPHQQIIFMQEIMSQIYKVFVRPHLEYGVTAWSPWNRKDIEALEEIQRRATRRISDIRGKYPERLDQLELTTLEERRIRGDAIEVFEYLKGFLDVDKATLFSKESLRQTILSRR